MTITIYGEMAMHCSVSVGAQEPSGVVLERVMATSSGLGRTSSEETILFWHRGLATSDIALAQAILEKAKRLGLGTSLSHR